jgi:NitT/TauT family transport system ATP-binding protein
MLCIQEAEFGYNGRAVVQIARLDVGAGEKVALVGRSGCGKTTVLAAVAGVIEPLKGLLEIEGAERDSQWRARNTARTLQNFPLFHWLTVRQNLELACRIRRVSSDHGDEILDQFSCLDLADRYPGGLSGGERCRASLAQAVVARPKLLLLDEPFTGLDTLVKEDVANSLFGFAALRHLGLLLVTHDLTDAVNFSDRILVLAGPQPTRVVAEFHTDEPNVLSRLRDTVRSYSND